MGFVERGLDAVVLNPSWVIAPYCKGLARALALSQQGKLKAYPSGGIGVTAGRDFVDAQLKAMERGVKGQRYIVNSANVSYRRLLSRVARLVGTRPPRFRIPNWLVRTGMRLDAVYCTTVLRDRYKAAAAIQQGEAFIRTSFYDQSKAVRELGISQTPLVSALEEVYAWAQGPDDVRAFAPEPPALVYQPPVAEAGLIARA